MLKILETIYSLPFLYGALAGTVLWLLYCRAKARFLDQREPLPGGQQHSVARMSRQWLAGLCALLSLGYVLLVTEKTELHTAKLNADVARCWTETYQQIKANVLINAENEQITRQFLDLQRQYDEDTSNWLKSLVSPPGDLVNQPTNSPERQAWGLKVSIAYQVRLDDLGRQFDVLAARRAELEHERAEHQLPEARCGRAS